MITHSSSGTRITKIQGASPEWARSTALEREANSGQPNATTPSAEAATSRAEARRRSRMAPLPAGVTAEEAGAGDAGGTVGAAAEVISAIPRALPAHR